MATEQYGSYRTFAKLLETPIGVIYRARDQATGQEVGIRVVGEELLRAPGVRERLARACEAASALRHPNIVPLLGYGDEPHETFIITDAVDGRNLDSVIASAEQLSVERRMAIMIQAVQALTHAHEHGVVHGGLTPAEIWLQPDGTVKVAGFGCAALLAPFRLSSSAPSGARIYLAPEQIERKEADARSDIFSLGLIFYELLTFHHPFQAAETAKTFDNILHQAGIPTLDRFADLPLGIWPILERCLAKQPDERYASSAELLAACNLLQRDIADDRQLMLVELHTVLPRLAEAAARPGAPAELHRLQREVEELLSSQQVTEYLPLNRMVSALAEHYRAIHAAFEFPSAATPETAAAQPALAAAEASEPAPAADRTAPSPAGKEETSPGERWDRQTQAVIEELFSESGTVSPTQSSPAADRDEIADLLRQIELAQEKVRRTVETTLLQVAGGAAAPLPEPEGASGDSGAEADGQVRTASESDGAAGPAAAPNAVPEAAEAAPAQEDDWFAAAELTSTEACAPMPPSEESAEASAAGRRAFIGAGIRRYGPRAALAAAGLVLLLAAGWWAQGHLRIRRGLFAVLADARTAVAQRLFGGGEPNYQKLLAGTPPALDAARGSDRQKEALLLEGLLEQARSLRAQGRFEESRVFLQRLLELRPGHEGATEELRLLDAAAAAPSGTQQAERSIEKRLADAAALIAGGKLRQAKVELDRIERLEPGLPETRRLLARLEEKNALAVREEEQRRAEEAESARRAEARAQRARRAESLYAQGDYAHARSLLDEWLADTPGDAQAQRLQERTAEALRSIGLYQSAMESRRYRDALDALAALGRANPADPNLAEMRRRAEARMAAATATLSIHRLREPATILIDGQPAGADGELLNHSLPIGSHQLAIRTDAGAQVAHADEFLEGQNVHYVYDAALLVLRPMLESDRALIAERKAKEEVHSFEVEHMHGLLRGSCRGELRISFYEVAYRPVSGPHAFQVPFRDLRLRTEGSVLRLMLVGTNRELAQFRTANPEAAGSVAQVWGKLKSLEK